MKISYANALARVCEGVGADVVAYDPRAGSNAKAELPELRIGADPYDAAAGADAVVLATEWDEFLDLDLPRLRKEVAAPVFVDARNALDGSVLAAAGFSYRAVGRPAEDPRS